MTKGSRVLEEKVNETQVSKTVFGRFNLNVSVDTISKQNGVKRLAVYIDNEILFYASGLLNLTILQHIAFRLSSARWS